MGVIALRKNDLATAANCFRRSTAPDAQKNLGIVQLLSGDYDAAAKTLADVDGCCHNPGLAYILTGQLDKASKAAHCKDQKVTYLKAIIAARKGDAAGVRQNLGAITNADLLARAQKDVEFAGYTW